MTGERTRERAKKKDAPTAGTVMQPLLSKGWVALHDVAWPGRPRASIDHVVFGPGGVFVIRRVGWSGRVDVQDGLLRQNGRTRDKVVGDAAEAARAVAEAMGGVEATAVVCVERDEPIEAWADDVLVCSPSKLVALLASLPETMDEATVARHEHRSPTTLPPSAVPRSMRSGRWWSR